MVSSISSFTLFHPGVRISLSNLSSVLILNNCDESILQFHVCVRMGTKGSVSEQNLAEWSHFKTPLIWMSLLATAAVRGSPFLEVPIVLPLKENTRNRQDCKHAAAFLTVSE